MARFPLSNASALSRPRLPFFPFDILARPPDGEWALRFGPENSLPIRLVFDSRQKVSVIEGNYRETGALSITADGELRIIRENNAGTFTLRWREPWLEGRDQDGQKVRFQRRNFEFAAKAPPEPPPPQGTSRPGPVAWRDGAVPLCTLSAMPVVSALAARLHVVRPPW